MCETRGMDVHQVLEQRSTGLVGSNGGLRCRNRYQGKHGAWNLPQNDVHGKMHLDWGVP